jgi:two-component system, cell cycle response regulator DivK
VNRKSKLPLPAQHPIAYTSRSMTDSAAIRPAKRILIVEDHPLNVRLLADLLEAHGFATMTAGDGLEAITLARRELPDLILMDLQLPDVSGLEVTHWLRRNERTRGIPIIAVTAFAMGRDEQQALAGGCDAYIAKPIALGELVRTIERFLG